MKKPPRKRKTVRVMDILMLLFLTIGVLLLAYPFVSDALNNFLDQQLITVYQHQANKENQAVVQKVIKKMNEKNAKQGGAWNGSVRSGYPKKRKTQSR